MFCNIKEDIVYEILFRLVSRFGVAVGYIFILHFSANTLYNFSVDIGENCVRREYIIRMEMPSFIVKRC